MPPINQQGSRTALITTLVVFVILFVVSTFFAFNFYSKANTADETLVEYKKKYNGYLSEADLASPAVASLQSAKTDAQNPFNVTSTMTAMGVAEQQIGGLQDRITGAAAGQTPAATAAAAAAALTQANKTLAGLGEKVDLTNGGLIAAVTRLTNLVVASRGELATERDASKAGRDAIAALTANVTAVQQTDAGALTQAQAKDKQEQDRLTAELAARQATLDAAVADAKAAKDRNEAAATESANKVVEADRRVTQIQLEIERYRNRQNRRPYVDDAAIRVADGRIIRAPGNGVCYINLGYGTGVANGLTFEVYDRASGVPPLPPSVNGDEQLPVGKASIEITHVGQDSSECRVVHLAPGALLAEGDLIENLIYDAHQKYTFDVYGNFDLASTGRPNPADAEVIKRLVTQWGGKLQADPTKITPDTDFLVLGAEPVVPEFSKDDLTPENQDKVDKATKALDAYQDVMRQARDLHIPVLNQNRFLYYVGYYDQRTR